MLLVVGVAITSWRIAPFGKDNIDRFVLRFLCVFSLALSLLWFISAYSTLIVTVVLVMFGFSLFFLVIGGIPGLRISLPIDARERILKEHISIWVILVIAVIIWQKFLP